MEERAPIDHSGGPARRSTFTILPWRGAAVVASWIVWPIVFFNGYWLASVVLMTGRRCSIEGCDPPENGFLFLLFLAAMFGPPIYLTFHWLRGRHTQKENVKV